MSTEELKQSPEEPYISERKHCPECGFLWHGEDIYQCFLRKRSEGDLYWSEKTNKEILEAAGHYGWTREEPKCFKHVVGVELPYNHPNHYDGVSYWMCPKCRTTWNRWTQKKEKIPEHEVKE